jgi:hypothetical protein
MPRELTSTLLDDSSCLTESFPNCDKATNVTVTINARRAMVTEMASEPLTSATF